MKRLRVSVRTLLMASLAVGLSGNLYSQARGRADAAAPQGSERVTLALVGATDMVSVVVRGTLVQVTTPDEMRGRVNAVELMFIGASNQLGQFESGLTAQWFGTVPAVALGGVGALVVTALWAWAFPELRRADLPSAQTRAPS